jgi:hypothetical protein
MLKNSTIRPIAGTFACAICSMLVSSPVFAADFPIGTYKAKEAKDLSLEFDVKGQFHVNNGGTLGVSGTYKVIQGRVQLTDLKGPWACTKPKQQKGTYIWTWNGTALTFLKDSDLCDERSGTLVPATWELQK